MCRSLEVPHLVENPCQEQGKNDIASQKSEEQAPKQMKLQFLEDVLAKAEVSASESLQQLLKETNDLSNKIFAKDCLQMIAEDSKYHLTLLVQQEIHEDQAVDEAPFQFLGFVVYSTREDKQSKLKCLSIHRLAVNPDVRGQGLGTQIIEWCQKRCAYIALAAIPTALKFYRKLGFKKVATWSEGGQAHPDMTIADDHTYMELRPTKRKGQKARSRKVH